MATTATDLSFFARTNLPDCNGTPTCTPVPVCPACGGLECLCRPRFFAGQLLTEDDLNRLDHYIVAKNRLHNRYLVGWGVACGLEVVCNVCGPDQASGGVLVKPGYALSPCGNDIVLCKAEPVDVCALVNACRPAQDNDCSDMFTSPQANDPPANNANNAAGVPKSACDGGSEDWVLAVCYSEKPARGLTALLRANTPPAGCGCNAGCSCGGNCGCVGGGDCSCGKSASSSKNGMSSTKNGCGCGQTAAPAPNANAANALPDQCEPTLTCEGYRFVVYKAPKPSYNQRQFGAAAKRFLCCILPLFQELGAPPTGNNANQQKAIDWVYTLRDAVRDFIINEGFYDCQIAARFAAVSVPAVGNSSAKLYTDLTESAYGYVSIGLLALQKCLCAALLPPCPDPSQTDCVPLATVSVARGHCRVLKVCNLAARKFLVTLPNITYWLSFFNVFSTGKGGVNSFRQLLEKLCCVSPATYTRGQLDQLELFHATQTMAAKAKAKPQDEADVLTARSTNAFGSLLADALANPDRSVSVQNLMLAALGATDADGKPFASAEELANPTEFLLLNQLVAPMIRQVAPEGGGDALQAYAALAGAGDSARYDDLSSELDALKKTLAKQEKAIAALKKRKG
jgi:hypothetical protein